MTQLIDFGYDNTEKKFLEINLKKNIDCSYKTINLNQLIFCVIN
jgi:hypothetical protein